MVEPGVPIKFQQRHMLHFSITFESVLGLILGSLCTTIIFKYVSAILLNFAQLFFRKLWFQDDSYLQEKITNSRLISKMPHAHYRIIFLHFFYLHQVLSGNFPNNSPLLEISLSPMFDSF